MDIDQSSLDWETQCEEVVCGEVAALGGRMVWHSTTDMRHEAFLGRRMMVVVGRMMMTIVAMVVMIMRLVVVVGRRMVWHSTTAMKHAFLRPLICLICDLFA